MNIIGVLIVLSSAAAQASPAPDWLSSVNEYRAQSGLSPVAEDPALSQGDVLHARYSVKNKNLIHSEDHGNQWYTPEGEAAAEASNGAGDTNDLNPVDQWMQAPFHALGILDPRLQRVGYGTYSDRDGSSSWLNVITGMGALPQSTRFPIVWPGQNTTISITKHWGEVPEPTQTCRGYSLPSGVPLIIQLEPGASTDVTDSTFEENGVSLDHCTFDAKSFNFPDSSWQKEGRNILSARNAIVVIPRKELKKNSEFRMTLTVGGRNISWSFKTQ